MSESSSNAPALDEDVVQKVIWQGEPPRGPVEVTIERRVVLRHGGHYGPEPKMIFQRRVNFGRWCDAVSSASGCDSVGEDELQEVLSAVFNAGASRGHTQGAKSERHRIVEIVRLLVARCDEALHPAPVGHAPIAEVRVAMEGQRKALMQLWHHVQDGDSPELVLAAVAAGAPEGAE